MVEDLIDDAEVPITTVIASGLTLVAPLPGVSAGHESSPDHAAPSRQGMQWSSSAGSGCPPYTRAGSSLQRGPCSGPPGPRRETSSTSTSPRNRVRRRQPRPALHRSEGARWRHRTHASRRHGELCECGRPGCLHTLLTERGLRRAIATALNASEPPTLEQIARLVLSDARAASVLERVAGHVVDALLPAVQMLDPETIMMGRSRRPSAHPSVTPCTDVLPALTAARRDSQFGRRRPGPEVP